MSDFRKRILDAISDYKRRHLNHFLPRHWMSRLSPAKIIFSGSWGLFSSVDISCGCWLLMTLRPIPSTSSNFSCATPVKSSAVDQRSPWLSSWTTRFGFHGWCIKKNRYIPIHLNNSNGEAASLPVIQHSHRKLNPMRSSQLHRNL